MKRLLLAFLLLCSPAFAYVDSNLDAKTTALAHYLEASQGTKINVGVTRLTGADDVFPSGIKVPIMQTHEVYNGTLYGGATQRTKLINLYNSGATIVMLSFNPSNPVTGANFNDRTGDPVHNIRVGDPYRSTWIGYLDNLATELNTLSAAGIPVILRFPQENNCPWFWWGKATDATTGASAAEYVAIAQEIVTYLRDTKGVHNVLYDYSPDSNTSGSCSEATTIDGSWYPGNSYVDILSTSFYMTSSQLNDGTRIATVNTAMAEAASRTGKIWGIAEGAIDFRSTPMSNFWTRYFDLVLADTNAKNASFINFWHSPWWFTSPTNSDFSNIFKIQSYSEYSKLQWGSGTIQAGTGVQGIGINGVAVK